MSAFVDVHVFEHDSPKKTEKKTSIHLEEEKKQRVPIPFIQKLQPSMYMKSTRILFNHICNHVDSSIPLVAIDCCRVVERMMTRNLPHRMCTLECHAYAMPRGASRVMGDGEMTSFRHTIKDVGYPHS